MTTEETSIATNTDAAGPADDAAQHESNVADVGSENAAENKTEAKQEETAKPEKTPEQREIERLRRGIDRRTRQLSEARAQINLTNANNGSNYQQSKDDSEPLSLTRAEIAEMVKAEAEKLAPTLQQQKAESDHRQSVVQSLASTWGQERFDEVSSELDDIFGGLTDRSGNIKPATEAVFESKSPKEVIEWLTDPENVDEAERISRLGSVQAGLAIARLEARISAKPKPTQTVSKAPPPLEPIKGQGTVTGAPDPSNTKAWIAWRNEQERKTGQ